MAEPGLDPVPVREPIAARDSLLLMAVWVRWLDALRTQQQRQEARLADVEARVAALEGP